MDKLQRKIAVTIQLAEYRDDHIIPVADLSEPDRRPWLVITLKHYGERHVICHHPHLLGAVGQEQTIYKMETVVTSDSKDWYEASVVTYTRRSHFCYKIIKEYNMPSSVRSVVDAALVEYTNTGNLQYTLCTNSD